MSKQNDRQIRVNAALAKRIKKVAKASGASENLIANFAVTAGLPMVEQKFDELKKVAA